METPWYMLRVEAQQSHSVEGNLRALGYEVYVPRLVVRKPHRRYRRVITREIDAFPGYVFFRSLLVGFEEVKRIGGVRGVLKVSRQSSVPATVTSSALNSVAEMVGGMNEAKDEVRPLALVVGDRAFVTEGPFKNYEGVVTQTRDGRLKLEIEGSNGVEVELARLHAKGVEERSEQIAG